jgi:serine/threonine protein kinase
MTPERWERIKEIFDLALEQPLAERDRYLDEVCAADAALKSEVASLLERHGQSSAFLDTPLLDAADQAWNQRSIARRRFSLAEVAGGRFQVVRLLGQGGMAMVFQAHDPRIDRDVAIKTISLSDIIDPVERQWQRDRFLKEARAAGALSHPNIVTIFDAGEQGDIAYIVMELVVGPTLQRFLAGGYVLDQRSFFHLIRQAADALDYAHRKGVVHRDVKPSNIMINQDRVIKITDFGIARILSSATTRSNPTVAGTPHFVSPEQIQAKPLDGRADQFSLAVIAYQILCGQNPFAAARLVNVIQKVVYEDPLPAHVLNPSLGSQTDQVLRRGLSKDPSGRYPICRDFVDALESSTRDREGWKPAVAAGQSA